MEDDVERAVASPPVNMEHSAVMDVDRGDGFFGVQNGSEIGTPGIVSASGSGDVDPEMMDTSSSNPRKRKRTGEVAVSTSKRSKTESNKDKTKLSLNTSSSNPRKRKRTGEVAVSTSKRSKTESKKDKTKLRLKDRAESEESYVSNQGDSVKDQASDVNNVDKQTETPEQVVQKHCESLENMFPTVDPEYLWQVCIQCGDDIGKFEKVVNEMKGSNARGCPTRVDIEKLRIVQDIQSRFLDTFDVKAFLEIFPEPTVYFTDPTRPVGNMYLSNSLAYLAAKYKKIHLTYIKKLVKQKEFHLYATVKMLNNYSGQLNKRARNSEWHIPEGVDIPFLYELALIENEEEVAEYMKEKEAARVVAYERAKANSALVECSCCYDDQCLLEEMGACSEGHRFCRMCIKRGSEEQLGQGGNPFSCLEPNCKSEFSLRTLQKVHHPKVFSSLARRRQADEVRAAGIEDLETCPFCDYTTIMASEIKVFNCLNLDCMRQSCRLCKGRNHWPLKCGETETTVQVTMRTYIEEQMTEALLRTCNSCKKKFLRSSGCNFMTCTCGSQMCYVCRKPYWECSKARRGCVDGGNERIHAKDVKQGAKNAKKKILAENPGVKLVYDPTKLLK